ncbi:trypsin-like peptidase domain-containing protein [Paenibacillus oenotherae]|uniref:Trypsin-like peptidase domain-containing protein n=1 Tax=Paenibacillus oenotherae TaxID=1435645 RepID=A0ABS7D6W1_9BACL|nr:trypsin-like peptidase domain-containing protein [Paenibacillus oenotherae]MBW7475664.1 trypsin-like peptidase domain-containing protein [Paenibacillus oenotherae]
MSLFDDDFYSTRVSRKAVRSSEREGKSFSFGKPRRDGSWSNVRIALTSSLVSAVAAVTVFGLSVGFGGGGSVQKVNPAVATVQTGDPLERTIQAAEKVRPAVVSIINEQALSSMGAGADDLDEYGDEGMGLEEASLGSGVIFQKEKGKAYIITNNHVVEDAAAVKAVLSNGEIREASVVGKDSITDLAVLEIDSKGIDVVAEIGDSNGLRAGQWVMAIGNPLGLSDSLTMGIVSKTHRIIPVSLSQDGVFDWEQEVIQIDASINQGNSGGPLIDLNGKVVGINSMKVADFGVEGVGFAIPSKYAMPIVESLMEFGKVTRPYLGVYTMDLEQYWAQQANQTDAENSGLDDEDWLEDGEAAGDGDGTELPPIELKLPKDVRDGVIVLEAVGPAKDAGLAFNDVIVKLDKQPISSTMELRKYLYAKKKIGDKIEVTLYRDGEKQTLQLELGEKAEE